MKNSEEAIEKVLAALRDADLPIGIERRILDGLEERAAVRSGSGWRQLLPVWVAPARSVAVGSLVCGVALAGVLVVAFAIPAIRRLGHAPVQSKRNSVPVGSAASTTSEAAAESAGPALLRAGVRSIGKKKAELSAAGAEAVLDSDSVALEEMHAASRPAPPMPLTEQERLLLRLVHKDDPVELAMLDSKVRALQDSEDKAEFQRFFGQATKQAASEQSVTEQAAPQQSTTEQVAPGQSTTKQAMPAQPGTEQSTPEQSVPEQSVPEQLTRQPSTPETSDPDQSATQQATPKPRTTGENE
jgi:hypothetical protein